MCIRDRICSNLLSADCADENLASIGGICSLHRGNILCLGDLGWHCIASSEVGDLPSFSKGRQAYKHKC
eukprot:8206477-Prorocentrum_lima.AAC.1